MLGRTYRMLRSIPRSVHQRLHTPTVKERWLARFGGNCLIHPSIEFTHRLPDEKLFTLGDRCIFERDLTIWLADEAAAEPRITIGNDVYIGRNSFVGSYFPITVGDNTLIGAYSYIISANHRFDQRDVPIAKQGYTGAPVELGEGVWLGTHVVVLPGTTIGQGAIVGAGSVVTRSIPPFQIWAGNPAKWIKDRP